ncbi:hypothetical protein OESDEN_25103, partial [Oesophagostomum dentatum]
MERPSASVCSKEVSTLLATARVSSSMPDTHAYTSPLPFHRINRYWSLVRSVVYVYKFLNVFLFLRLKSVALVERLRSQ